jgi:hypothetical protein
MSVPYSVFVSYSTRDLETANALHAWIAHAGASVYIAEYSTVPGTPLASEVLHAIQRCDLFLLLWSSNAKQSEWVPQEIGAATGACKPIMPVVLHAGIELPGFIRDLKYLALYNDPQAAAHWLHAHVLQQVTEKDAIAKKAQDEKE